MHDILCCAQLWQILWKTQTHVSRKHHRQHQVPRAFYSKVVFLSKLLKSGRSNLLSCKEIWPVNQVLQAFLYVIGKRINKTVFTVEQNQISDDFLSQQNLDECHAKLGLLLLRQRSRWFSDCHHLQTPDSCRSMWKSEICRGIRKSHSSLKVHCRCEYLSTKFLNCLSVHLGISSSVCCLLKFFVVV